MSPISATAVATAIATATAFPAAIATATAFPAAIATATAFPAAPATAGGWGVEGSLPLFAVVLVAGVGTGLLFLVSLVAYRRRRSAQYALISVAVGALLARSVVGAGTVLGVVPMPVHHFLEHSLDFLIAAVILYAVYAYAPGSVGDDAPSE